MMTKVDPKELVEMLLERSICAVQVGAVIADKQGVFSWGWNHVGDGFGKHAEIHAIERANKERLLGATIYIAAKRVRTGKPITARPCYNCDPVLDKYRLHVWYRDGARGWVKF